MLSCPLPDRWPQRRNYNRQRIRFPAKGPGWWCRLCQDSVI